MINYAFYPFEFGYLKIGCENGAVVFLNRAETIDCENRPSEISELVNSQLCEYFSGKRKEFDFPIELHGTDFQMKVWKALCEIPYGQTRSYKDIAAAVKNPKASRAVGTANHNNPVAIAVPCHRVVNADGSLGGYGCGIEMKKWLLSIESKNHSAKA